jgi:hypothetical protein
MPISIITRSYWTSELKELVSNLKQCDEVEKEVIAVCNRNDYDLDDITLILENSNRFEARIKGIESAHFDKILLLDSDQILEDGLLHELENRNEDMIIIPEKSLGKGFTAKCLDDWRTRNESLARQRMSPYLPVVPRFYKKEPLKRAIGKLPKNAYKIISHEDSILYYATFKISQNIKFSTRHIYNRDPDFLTIMRKAFHYGKSSRSVKFLDLPSDLISLLYKLDRNSGNVGELGFGKGYIIQIPRAFAYEFGRIL